MHDIDKLEEIYDRIAEAGKYAAIAEKLGDIIDRLHDNKMLSPEMMIIVDNAVTGVYDE
jgi:hypothetical protein